MLVVAAEKVAEVADAVTVTEGGIVRAEALSDRVMLAPPVGAAFVSVTVQVLELFSASEDGLQVSEETATAAVKPMVAVLELLL
jgi:hypothetical protein